MCLKSFGFTALNGNTFVSHFLLQRYESVLSNSFFVREVHSRWFHSKHTWHLKQFVFLKHSLLHLAQGYFGAGVFNLSNSFSLISENGRMVFMHFLRQYIRCPKFKISLYLLLVIFKQVRWCHVLHMAQVTLSFSHGYKHSPHVGL